MNEEQCDPDVRHDLAATIRYTKTAVGRRNRTVRICTSTYEPQALHSMTCGKNLQHAVMLTILLLTQIIEKKKLYFITLLTAIMLCFTHRKQQK